MKGRDPKRAGVGTDRSVVRARFWDAGKTLRRDNPSTCRFTEMGETGTSRRARTMGGLVHGGAEAASFRPHEDGFCPPGRERETLARAKRAARRPRSGL